MTETAILYEGQNTGIIEVQPRPSDFVAGGETGIVRRAINPSGDWRPYAPPGEWQKDLKADFETDACVSFSAGDSLETYANCAIANNLYPAESVNWLRSNGYFNPDNKTLNFSDRAIARLSNTTHDGNSLPNVGDTIRTFGLVPEAAWPFPFAAVEANPSHAWEIYYDQVPQDVVALGKEFLKHFTPKYEWVKIPGWNVNLRDELTYSPLQIATAVCWPWNTSTPINGCGPGAAHGTMLEYVEYGGQSDILDHYVPFQKLLAPGYDITYAIRYVLEPVAVQPPPASFHYMFSKQLTFNSSRNDPAELLALQKALQFLKRPNGLSYMKSGVFGPFGPQTKAALDLFERDHRIPDPQPGCNFGPLNRAAMNAVLNP